MAELLLGKPVSDAIYSDLSSRIEILRKQKIHPKLAIVRVGKNAADEAYERQICSRATDIGVKIEQYHLDADVNRLALFADIEGINVDKKVHGCLVMRPLPKHIDQIETCNLIAPEKDVDGSGAKSLAGVFMDLPEGYAPCTAQACMEMLDYYDIPVAGKHVVVVGRSLVVGKPVAMLLLARDATVTLCHTATADLEAAMREADIVICAAGRAKAFGADCFSEGQIVLDVGMNEADDGSLCGDVDFSAVENMVSAITPVPRGIGSATTAVLLKHVVEAAEKRD